MPTLSSRWIIRLGLLALALAVVIYQNSQDGQGPPGAGPAPAPTSSRTPRSPQPQAALSHTLDAATRAGFAVYPETSLVDHRSNDGDSFLVSHGGGQEHVRLYFVDAPESYIADHNAARLGHQARYFGCQIPAAVAVGQEAKAFTRDLLGRAPFTLITRHEAVFDSDRIFGFVLLPDGSYLSEHLVANGLARIYTQGADTPDGRSRREFEDHLKSIEAEARGQVRGAWSQPRPE